MPHMNADLYPFQQHFFTLPSQQKMHYLDEGEGPALLALHGNPTWSFYYRDLVKKMRGQFRCIVPDHIGCGFSDKPLDKDYSYHLEQRVKDVESLVSSLGLREITLVLHDWGGMIGLALATRNPGLIKRIVLMNTSGFPLPKSKGFPLALTLSRAPIIGSLLIRGLNAFALSASWIGCKKNPLSPALRRAYRAPYSDWASRRAVHRFVQDIPLGPQDPSWELVNFVSQNLDLLRDKPIQIIWGELDFIFDRHFLAEWRRRIPEAEIHSYKDAGHYILEDLGEEALALIQSFVTRPLKGAHA